MIRKAAVSLLAAMLVSACGEREISSPSAESEVNPPESPNLHRVACSGNLATKVVKCGQPVSDVSGDLIVGQQNVYVKLTSTNVNYDAGTSAFTFDVTVQNLIPQPIGTVNGTAPDPSNNGVRVFFQAGPTVTGGTGNASVGTPDGVDTFTSTNQPYYKYSASTPAMLGPDGILSNNEVSDPKTWTLTIDPTVTSFTFFVYVSAAVHYPNGYVNLSSPSPFLLASQSHAITAESRSAVGNLFPSSTFTYVSSNPAVATVDTNGTVSALTPGTAYVRVTSSESTMDSVIVQVCPNLAVGEVYTTSGAAAGSTCLSGYAGAEYTAMPYNSSSSSSASLTVTASGIQAVTGPPTPARIPNAGLMQLSGLPSIETTRNGAMDLELSSGVAVEASNLIRQVAYATHIGGPHADEEMMSDMSEALPPDEGVLPASGGKQRLMWHPTEAATGRVAASADLAPNTVAVSNVATTARTKATPTVGDIVSYNVAQGCSGSVDMRVGMVRSISARAVIVADTSNPAGGFTTAQYDSIALEHDTVAYAAITPAFGTPTDLDDNGGRTVLFFTRAVNELSPPASSVVNQGYFASRDLISNTSCARSNEGEMMYMMVPDPTGAVNSNVRTVSFVRGATVGTQGHELARLINATTRLYVTSAPLEDAWLDEALGNVAEDLMFYRTAQGLAPGGNINLSSLTTGPNASRRVAAFNTYANQNFGRWRSWLQRPDTSGVGKTNVSLAETGVAWAFLRYAIDRHGSGNSFISQLVNGSNTGFDNLTAVIGAPAKEWVRDFIIASYADDAVTGAAATYAHPSWNFRSVYGGLGGFPLGTRPLTDSVGLTLSYAVGGTAFTRFGVPASGFATITLKSAGVDPLPHIYWSIIRTK